jgi:hypothetical protein
LGIKKVMPNCNGMHGNVHHKWYNQWMMLVENSIKTSCHIRFIDISSTKAICQLKTSKHFEVLNQVCDELWRVSNSILNSKYTYKRF